MKSLSLWKVLPAACFGATALADGFGVDKVYHPYVDAMEQEIEYRVTGREQSPKPGAGELTHKLGYGRAFGYNWFGELYLIGRDPHGDNLELEAYELEVIHQLTEQGEFWADWGLIFELEKAHNENAWEAAAGVLAEKETGRWSTAVNFLVIDEWGDDIEDELETRLAIQARYRYRPWLEPGIELHSAENTRAIGPLIQGDYRLGIRRNLHWEAGAYLGLDSETPDTSFRLGIEYEF